MSDGRLFAWDSSGPCDGSGTRLCIVCTRSPVPAPPERTAGPGRGNGGKRCADCDDRALPGLPAAASNDTSHGAAVPPRIGVVGGVGWGVGFTTTTRGNVYGAIVVVLGPAVPWSLGLEPDTDTDGVTVATVVVFEGGVEGSWTTGGT